MLRVAAYGLCFADHSVLLAHWTSPARGQSLWTLPGGGIGHGEDPFDAVVREVAEETGYDVEVERLLGVDSRVKTIEDGRVLHHIGVFYLVEIVGGELRHETDGSTDRAEWFPLETVSDLERATLVDVGLELARARPASGHTRPVAVAGLLRD